MLGHDAKQCGCVVCKTKRARAATIKEDQVAIDPPEDDEEEADLWPEEYNPLINLDGQRKPAEPKRKARTKRRGNG